MAATNGRAYMPKCAVMGASGTGKTTLCLWFCTNAFEEKLAETTADQEHVKAPVIDDVHFSIIMLDTKCSDESGKLKNEWMEHNDAIVLVYDITSRHSFDIAQRYGLAFVECFNEEVPVMVVATKSDKDQQRQVSEDDGRYLSGTLGKFTGFYETSSKDGTNVERAFCDLMRLYLRRKQEGNSSSNKDKCIVL